MEKLSKKAIIFGWIKYALSLWMIILLIRYLYNYGFQYIVPNEPFVVESLINLVILSGLYTLYFAKSR